MVLSVIIILVTVINLFFVEIVVFPILWRYEMFTYNWQTITINIGFIGSFVLTNNLKLNAVTVKNVLMFCAKCKLKIAVQVSGSASVLQTKNVLSLHVRGCCMNNP